MKKNHITVGSVVFLLLVLGWYFQIIPRGYIIDESRTVNLDLVFYEDEDEDSLFKHTLQFAGGSEKKYRSWFGKEYRELSFFHGFYQNDQYDLESSDTDILIISNEAAIPLLPGNVEVYAKTNDGQRETFHLKVEKTDDSRMFIISE